MKKTIIGTLAHVDAGKTTLSESMLYLSGSIRTSGRVDHGNTLLDYDEQERSRGITIFASQATFDWKDTHISLLDTPGHIDFSSEMERTLQVLDYAIVVINSLDGVQAHTKTIWNLLKHYQIPTFLFVNKMDISHYNQEEILEDIRNNLDERCIDFTTSLHYESLALCDDELLDLYLNNNTINDQDIAMHINKRHIFPCYFGSALKHQGIKVFLNGLDKYVIQKKYPKTFGARVYKISRENGQRLTHVKITGGVLKVKEKLLNDEKVDQIRQYSGHKFQAVESVEAGEICVIKGFKDVQTGDGLGFEDTHILPMLEPYMNYQLILPKDCDRFEVLRNIKQLSEEDPQLHIQCDEKTENIYIQLMGEIQIEILKNMMKERFHVNVDFSQGQIIYKETIVHKVEGVGHFEPLRHYAEVHLMLEPIERGAGLQFETECLEDTLDRHYQRLILTHLQEKEHIGVLTGSPITDIKITLVAGKAHLKHTEGGDFREATYRAIRHALKSSECLLLEPYYQFELDIPSTYMSKAIYDIESMQGEYILPDEIGDRITIKGTAPVSQMQNYQLDVISYTKGEGHLFCSLNGYKPCLHQEEVIKTFHYDSEADIDNPTGSIFCAHGAGFYVKWDQVKDYMHIPMQYKIPQQTTYKTSNYDNQDLETIFERTYGPIKQRLSQSTTKPLQVQQDKTNQPQQLCLLVDGYNVIHSWPELKELAKENLDVARSRLIDILSDYQGYKQCLLILVFDAYKVKDNIGTSTQEHNLYIVYTKEAQTADMYIERATHQLSIQYQVVVATSDALEQMIVLGRGGRRMSSRELLEDIEYTRKEKMSEFKRKQDVSRNYLLEGIKDIHHNKS
ncbi:MAG: TetM/TetW/TetO/TetS family tetracycline resistance ribosomal protection protein [Coprobacillus sp.]